MSAKRASHYLYGSWSSLSRAPSLLHAAPFVHVPAQSTNALQTRLLLLAAYLPTLLTAIASSYAQERRRAAALHSATHAVQ